MMRKIEPSSGGGTLEIFFAVSSVVISAGVLSVIQTLTVWLPPGARWITSG